MRDIIWTIIVIWVVWRLVDAFRGISATRKSKSQPSNYNENTQNSGEENQPKKGELKSDAGEYVEFEEIK